MPSEAGERAIKESIVQLLDPTGTVRGCGLLVDLQHVITCAHVVALALPGVDPERDERPVEPVRMIFPYRSHADGMSAHVVVWKPVRERPPLDLIEDIAVLRLNQSAPESAVPHALVLQTDWAGREYMAHGFTESEPQGSWPNGEFKGETVGGWVQLLSADGQDLQVDEGFSGCGVWDEQAGEFAGIVVANKRRGNYVKSVSYMIPSVVLKRAWSDLPVVATTAVPILGQLGPGQSRHVVSLGNASDEEPTSPLRQSDFGQNRDVVSRGNASDQDPTSPAPTHPTSPVEWVLEGARRIPTLTYAIGVIALVAAAAISIGFFIGHWEYALWGGIAVFVGMILVRLYAAFQPEDVRINPSLPIKVVVWGCVLAFLSLLAMGVYAVGTKVLGRDGMPESRESTSSSHREPPCSYLCSGDLVPGESFFGFSLLGDFAKSDDNRLKRVSWIAKRLKSEIDFLDDKAGPKGRIGLVLVFHGKPLQQAKGTFGIANHETFKGIGDISIETSSAWICTADWGYKEPLNAPAYDKQNQRLVLSLPAGANKGEEIVILLAVSGLPNGGLATMAEKDFVFWRVE